MSTFFLPLSLNGTGGEELAGYSPSSRRQMEGRGPVTNFVSTPKVFARGVEMHRTAGLPGRAARFAAVTIAAGFLQTGCAGQPPSSTALPAEMVVTSLPPGYAEFCSRHPALCRLPDGLQAAVRPPASGSIPSTRASPEP